MAHPTISKTLSGFNGPLIDQGREGGINITKIKIFRMSPRAVGVAGTGTVRPYPDHDLHRNGDASFFLE